MQHACTLMTKRTKTSETKRNEAKIHIITHTFASKKRTKPSETKRNETKIHTITCYYMFA